jgi:hypothetical protein
MTIVIITQDLKATSSMIHDPWFIYTFGINANILIAYLLEYPASTGRWPGFFLMLHFINAISSFVIPWAGSHAA